MSALEERIVQINQKRKGVNHDAIKGSIVNLLDAIGEDSRREGLIKTPDRVAKAYAFLTKGYDEDPVDILNKAIFQEDIDEMVVVKDIEFYSLCEHHLLPFFGKAFVAYIPDGKIVGVSKLSRLVDVYARRLQVQERLTKQIAQTLKECLEPQGVAVVMQAQHMCMQMRGVQQCCSSMVTSSMMGAFQDSVATRNEFMNFIKQSL